MFADRLRILPHIFLRKPSWWATSSLVGVLAISSKCLDVPLSSRHDTSLGGLYRLLLRPLLLARPLYEGHPPFLHSREDASILPMFSYSPSVGSGFVYPLFLLLTLLQRGSWEGLSPIHCPVNRHCGLVVERVHPLCWWTLVYVVVPGQNRRGYVDIWPPSGLSFVDVNNALNSHDL